LNLFLKEVIASSYLDEKKKIIFLHIGKSAGTTLNSFFLFQNNYDVNSILEETFHPEVGWDQAVWSKIQVLPGYMLNVPTERSAQLLGDPTYRKIVFLRNPIERFWSSWVSKIFLGEPRYLDIRRATILPEDEIILANDPTTADIGAIFDRFVAYFLESNFLQKDNHFLDFSSLLIGRPSDTELVELKELNKTMQSIYGFEWENFSGNRNSARDILHGPICSPKSYELLRIFYHEDFLNFDNVFSMENKPEWLPADNRASFDFAHYRFHNRAAYRLKAAIEQKILLEKNVDRLEKNVDRLEKNVDRLGKVEQELRDIENSTMWRALSPLRSLIGIFK